MKDIAIQKIINRIRDNSLQDKSEDYKTGWNNAVSELEKYILNNNEDEDLINPKFILFDENELSFLEDPDELWKNEFLNP